MKEKAKKNKKTEGSVKTQKQQEQKKKTTEKKVKTTKNANTND